MSSSWVARRRFVSHWPRRFVLGGAVLSAVSFVLWTASVSDLGLKFKIWLTERDLEGLAATVAIGSGPQTRTPLFGPEVSVVLDGDDGNVYFVTRTSVFATDGFLLRRSERPVLGIDKRCLVRRLFSHWWAFSGG